MFSMTALKIATLHNAGKIVLLLPALKNATVTSAGSFVKMVFVHILAKVAIVGNIV